MPPRRHAPGPLLAARVEGFYTVARRFGPDDAFFILPDAGIDLVFHAGAAVGEGTLDGPGGERPLPDCYALGLLSSPLTLRATGTLHTLRVRFYPWGFAPLLEPFLGSPAGGPALALPALPVRDTVCRLLPADPDAAVRAVEAFLTARALAAARLPHGFAEAARRVVEAGGDLRVSELTADVTDRATRRQFRRLLGRGPKSLARVARFERVRDALWADPDADLADLARARGYADQAHLQREFRLFAGRTPGDFAAGARRSRAAFSGAGAENVRNLQDAPARAAENKGSSDGSEA